MPHEILFRERYGPLGQQTVYIKPPAQNVLVRLGSAVTLPRSFYDGFSDVFRQIFLPQGYPESVSDDYWEYQVWDTLQAFCSTISGALTFQAIMKGVGVGSSVATPLGAAVTWIMKDGTGMIGRIAFAWWKGTSLDANCKKWRLCADALNDIAMGIELSLPYFNKYSTEILCISTSLKAIVGVAGGATRAAITQHQAVRDNMADVSAKDGSQETCVNLAASLLGILTLTYFYTDQLVWYFFALLTMGHLYANYRAVKSLKLTSLNEGRLLHLLHFHMINARIADPEMINKEESVVLGCGLTDQKLCGFQIILGSSLKKSLSSGLINAEYMKFLINFYRKKKYLLVVDVRRKKIYVCLHHNESSSDVIHAYFHAIYLGVSTSLLANSPLESLEKYASNGPLHQLRLRLDSYQTNEDRLSPRITIESMIATEDIISREMEQFLPSLQAGGWSIINHHLPVDQWRADWTYTDDSDDAS